MLYNWFENITFANNWVLPFLLMVPVFAWIRARTKSTYYPTLTVSSAHSFTARTSRNVLYYLPVILRLLAIAAVIIAIARPQIKDEMSRVEGEGIAIVLCIDVSGSMMSRDFRPHRLGVAKQVAEDFIRNRPVDQIGLVVFAGESFTQFPLSTNREALIQQVRATRSGMLNDGTLIGEGLATSVQRLDEVPSKSKVIVLLTDGREEAPDTRIIDPITALEIAKAKKVKVYTIGMGADNAIAVSEINPKMTYAPNTAFIDEQLLKRIANETGGDYFRARNQESLEQIYSQIDRLEKSDVTIINETRTQEQFHWFILAAFILLLIEFILKFTLLRTFP